MTDNEQSKAPAATERVQSERDIKWIFPTTACPRCRGYNTEAYSTDSISGKQYRRCRSAVCRKRYCVLGTPAGKPDPPAAEEPADPPAKDFRCPYCANTYQRRNALTRHINRKHPGEKPYGQDEESD